MWCHDVLDHRSLAGDPNLSFGSYKLKAYNRVVRLKKSFSVVVSRTVVCCKKMDRLTTSIARVLSPPSMIYQLLEHQRKRCVVLLCTCTCTRSHTSWRAARSRSRAQQSIPASSAGDCLRVATMNAFSSSKRRWLVPLFSACCVTILATRGMVGSILRQENGRFMMARILSSTNSIHEGGGSGGEGEEDESSLLATIVGIVLCLIVVTLAFESFKHHLESQCGSENSMELILEKLFGELTVLGFLAMVIFLSISRACWR